MSDVLQYVGSAQPQSLQPTAALRVAVFSAHRYVSDLTLSCSAYIGGLVYWILMQLDASIIQAEPLSITASCMLSDGAI